MKNRKSHLCYSLPVVTGVDGAFDYRKKCWKLEFQKWAQDNVVLVELDFPRRTPQALEIKQQNNELQQAFGIKGFPTVHFAKASTKDGKVNFVGLGSSGYLSGGPAVWLANADEIIKSKKS